MAKVDATARTIGPSGAARPAVDEAGIDALMREFFHKESSMGGLESAAETPIVTYTAAPRRDFDTAAEILERASQGFDVLINRSQLLEHNLDDASERPDAPPNRTRQVSSGSGSRPGSRRRSRHPSRPPRP